MEPDVVVPEAKKRKPQQPKRKYPVVLVLWDDAEVSNSWEELPEEEVELNDSFVETIGFLVRKTAKYYLIASTLSGTHTNATTKIPVGMVKEFKNIKA